MSEPTGTMSLYQSIKCVRAGEITEIVPVGCYVQESDGSSVLRIFEPNMTARYQPKIGDFWVVYDDGYQSLSPRDAFLRGYMILGATGMLTGQQAANSQIGGELLIEGILKSPACAPITAQVLLNGTKAVPILGNVLGVAGL